MRKPSPRRFHPRQTAVVPADPIARRMAPLASVRGPVLIPAELKAEAPGPDGIRHGLVAHVRQLIAAGEYDTPQRWEAAEERLLDRVLGGR
jgi:hypothetical protein